jgi:uncharacterized protein (TIGR02271 family)
MTSSDRVTAVGVFENRAQADRAVDDLRRAGFREDQIGVVTKHPDAANRTGDATAESGTMWEEGTVTGLLAGTGLGALIGLGVLAGVVPVIGPIIAGGALSVVLANAAGGAVIAGIVGALVGLGIPEEEARYYENEVKEGRTVVTVKADNRFTEAMSIMQRHGGYDRSGSSSTASTTTSTAAVTAPTARVATSGEQKIQLHEEQLNVHKQPVQTGEVRVHKDVITEHRTIDVPVQREEVVIERHPVHGQTANSGSIRQGEEIRIPIKEEQVNVSKDTVVKEEVNVGKRNVQGTERVAGDVRKEEIRVDKKGDVDVKGNTREPRR